jgi:hypothetical protein
MAEMLYNSNVFKAVSESHHNLVTHSEPPKQMSDTSNSSITRAEECCIEDDAVTQVEPQDGLCTSAKTVNLTTPRNLASKLIKVTSMLMLLVVIGIMTTLMTNSLTQSNDILLIDYYDAEAVPYSSVSNITGAILIHVYRYLSWIYDVDKINLEVDKLAIRIVNADVYSILQDMVNEMIYLGNIHPSDVLVSLNCQVYIISCLFTFHCKCIMLSLPCIRLVFTLC